MLLPRISTMGNLKTSKLRLLRHTLLFFLAGCAAYQPVKRLHEPPRSALEIISSDIWRTEKDIGIEISYRVIYKLTNIEEPTNVDILFVLKSVSNEVLSQKKRTERRMSGIYPVAYSFNWKKKCGVSFLWWELQNLLFTQSGGYILYFT